MVACLKMEYPAGLTPLHFLRLSLTRGTETVSTNFYMRGPGKGDYRAIRVLPKANLEAVTRVERQGALAVNHRAAQLLESAGIDGPVESSAGKDRRPDPAGDL